MIAMRIEQGQPEPGKLVYRNAEYAFDTVPRPRTCGASFIVNELELMLDDEEISMWCLWQATAHIRDGDRPSYVPPTRAPACSEASEGR